MINKKKGQGLSLNVIIIAAIALIVLIVLVFILTERLQIFGKGLEDCASKTGIPCSLTKCSEITDGSYVEIPGTNCPKGSYCCLKVSE